jgi:hypothetical protein
MRSTYIRNSPYVDGVRDPRYDGLIEKDASAGSCSAQFVGQQKMSCFLEAAKV